MIFDKGLLKYGIIGLFIIGIDRITKLAALTYCMSRRVVNQYIACDLTFNRGASFALFYSTNSLIFVIITSIIALMTIGVGVYAVFRYKKCGYSIIGETLVIAGSLSNIIDRIVYRGVIDFVELSYGTFIWPSFNVADMCIVMGVCIMFISAMRES